jgi:hypothetical protein
MLAPTPERSERAQIEANALMCQAHSSTFRICNETNPAKGGTAVAVNIGSRFFLATARHVIPEGDDVTVVLRGYDESVTQFAARHVHPGADVGVLELRQEDVPRFGGTFVTPDRLIANLDQREENAVAVIGYPAGLMTDHGPLWADENESVRLCQVTAFTFLSQTLPLREWPTSGTLSPPNVGRDVFIHFEPENRLHPLPSAGAGAPLSAIDGSPPPPPGISGGGIWLMRAVEEKTLWRPRTLLCGIQSHALTSGKWLRGVSLGVLLEVVERNYPDLEPHLRQARTSPV